MKFADVVLSKVILSDFQENAYIVALKDRSDCVVVDPGMTPDRLLSFLESKNLTPKALLITHGHWDHIGGVAQMRKRWNDVKIYIGEKERDKLTDPVGNLSSMFGFPMTTYDADKTVVDGESFEIAGLTFKTLDVPGHSRGHVAYLLETEERPIVFCGDAVFAESVGRTDFADGDGPTLIRSIRSKLLTLPNETLLCPGHGPETTVQNEKRYNPFLQ